MGDARLDCRIGTAGWQVPVALAGVTPAQGTHLQRYATRVRACEINSAFYRPHTSAIYANWAAQTPPDFRFAVKLPKAITHQARLRDAGAALDVFLSQVRGLGDRLGCLLIQLPPSLAFHEAQARSFLATLRARYGGAAALEPRHASWFTRDGDAVLAEHHVTRVLADPVLHAGGEAPGGWPGLIYLRLHGSPRVYASAYDPAWLRRLAARMGQARMDGAARALWCIFDNTAAGAALPNALQLQADVRALEAA